jgi:hypothetical protein
MPERKERASSQEKFKLTWSMPATTTVMSTVGAVQQITPDGNASDEVLVAEEVDAIAQGGEVEQLEPVESSPEPAGYRPIDDAYMESFHSSPKKLGKFGFTLDLSKNQLKVVSLVAWSTISVVGAALIGKEAGPAVTLHLAALGGVWAAISAILWFLPSKLK